MEHIRIEIGGSDFELACMRYYEKRHPNATRWLDLPNPERVKVRAAMLYAWQGLIETKH